MAETGFTPKKQTLTPDTARPIIHTYGDDMAHAMDATDAKVVAQLLDTAREREQSVKDTIHYNHERAWYSTGAVILLVLAIAAGVYGFFHYKRLTVPVTPTYSVGIFPSISAVSTKDTTIQDLVSSLTTNTTLSLNKPTLVPLTHSDGTLLSKEELFSFLNARVSEPFQTTMDLVRYGVLRTETSISPFLIFSVTDPEIATKELLIAEPTLLQTFAPALAIDVLAHETEIGKGFDSGYKYNLPLRTVSAANTDTNTRSLVLYYGYATDHTIVLATDPSVLKAVYDTIITQR